MTNDKIVLNPKQGKMLKSFDLSTEKNRIECIMDHERYLGKEDLFGRRIPDLTTENLIKAIYIGYEVEKTPEEKLVDYYNDFKKVDGRDSEIITKTIINTLNILDKKVEGIN